MKIYHIVAALLIGVLTQGCATNIGNVKTEDFGSYLQLEKGKSTKEDVHRIFGQPQDVKYLESGSGSIWEYIYARSTMSGATFVPIVGLFAGGNNVDAKVSTFYFNELGVFSNVETVSKSKYVNQWVGITKGVSDAVNDKAPDRVQNEMNKLKLPFDEKAANRLKGIETWTD